MSMSLADLRVTDENPGSPYLLHHVQVTGVTELSPSFRRITLAGPQLDRVRPTGWDQRMKVFLPLADLGLQPVPMVDDWYAAWRQLPDDRRNPMRTYTVRAVRPDMREVDVDVVRHGASGPAGAWIERARPGDELVVYLPNAGYAGSAGGIDFDPPGGLARVLLAGDATAVPAIASILEHLPPAVTGHAIVEVPDPEDLDALSSHRSIERRAVVQGPARGAALVAAVREVAPGMVERAVPTALEDVDIETGLLWEVPRDAEVGARDATTYAWLAGEAGAIKGLRRYLVSELGWDRKTVAFMGYWREGRCESNL